MWCGLHVGFSLVQNHRNNLHSKLTFSVSLLPSSDPVLYGGTDLPNRLLYQWGGGPAVQAAQQHGGRLLVRALCPLHLLHHSGTAVCRQSLPPWLRSQPYPPLNWNKRLWKIYGIYKNTQRLKIKNNKLWSEAWNMEVSYVSRDRSTMEHLTTKRWKWINEQNTKGRHGHKGVEECERGQPRLSQHPATVDLKYAVSLLLFCWKRVLNVPLSWQLRPQCCCTFLEDHYSHSSTWLAAARPVALSTHLRRHDRLLLFLASLSLFQLCVFSVVVHFVFLFFFLAPSSPFHWSSLSVIEVHWTEPLRDIGGVYARLALKQGLFSPVASHGPMCVVWESSCDHSCLGQHTGCCGREEGAGMPPLYLQPAPAQEQVATRGDLCGQRNKRSSAIKENATQCKNLHNVIYIDKKIAIKYKWK